MRQHRSRQRLITLGWPQFFALAAGLCALGIVLVIVLGRDTSEALYRLEVGEYEQEFGFEVGLVKGFPEGPPAGMWGIVSVTPGGRMDKAGIRSGDLVFNRHGYAFTELSWAIREAARGRAVCVVVVNAEEARTGSGRKVCLK